MTDLPNLMLAKVSHYTVLCCALQVDSRAMYEVKKDLHRTLPNNRHFKSGGVGVNCYNQIRFIGILKLEGPYN